MTIWPAKEACLWVIAALAIACTPERALEGLPEAAALRAARPTFTVDGLEISLTVDVARNAMPGMPRRGIMVGAWLKPVRTPSLKGLDLLLPEGTAITRIFVVNGDRVWVTEAQPRGRPMDDEVRVNAGDGPDWERGQTVDVYAEVTMTRWPTVYVAARGEQIKVVQ